MVWTCGRKQRLKKWHGKLQESRNLRSLGIIYKPCAVSSIETQRDVPEDGSSEDQGMIALWKGERDETHTTERHLIWVSRLPSKMDSVREKPRMLRAQIGGWMGNGVAWESYGRLSFFTSLPPHAVRAALWHVGTFG